MLISLLYAYAILILTLPVAVPWSLYPDVLLLEDFDAHIKDVEDFNLLLFGFMSMSEGFISIQGGNAAVGSYFGKTNVILIKAGPELNGGDYQYFHKFSGGEIWPTTTDKQLIETVQSLF